MVLSAMVQGGHSDLADAGVEIARHHFRRCYMSIGYVAGIEKARKTVKPVVKEEVKSAKKSTKKAAKEPKAEEFD